MSCGELIKFNQNTPRGGGGGGGNILRTCLIYVDTNLVPSLAKCDVNGILSSVGMFIDRGPESVGNKKILI